MGLAIHLDMSCRVDPLSGRWDHIVEIFAIAGRQAQPQALHHNQPRFKHISLMRDLSFHASLAAARLHEVRKKCAAML